MATRHLRLRPIEPADAPRIERAFSRLSPRTVYLRFLAPIPRIGAAELTRLTNVDHHHREAIVALDGDEIVGVARYESSSDVGAFQPRRAEVAVVVADAWQRRGVGRHLLDELSALAAARGYDELVCTILVENHAALALVRSHAPGATMSRVDNVLEVRIPLTSVRTPGCAA